MYFTGFADEAARSLDKQIAVTKELGWTNIESRCIDGVNIHDLTDEAFERVVEQLDASGVRINCFGSTIANWAKHINAEQDTSLDETNRAIPRMQRLGTKLVRIMSYAVLPDRGPEDQMKEERFKRLREICDLFNSAGITPVHENCMNFGGMSWTHTLELLDNVPGMKLVYDTGNPAFNPDRSKPEPWPRQKGFEFYSNVKDHVAYIHIKDCTWDEAAGKETYTYPGEGHGEVREILTDMISSGYDGGISIEPHMAAVFHQADDKPLDEDESTAIYLEYGKRLMALVNEIKAPAAS